MNNITINGVDKDGITIRGTGDAAEVILAEQLSPFDETQLEAALAETGADNEEKLGNYTLPNGQDGLTFFLNFANTVGNLNRLALRAELKDGKLADYLINTVDIATVRSTLDQHQTTLDYHETRITALEP